MIEKLHQMIEKLHQLAKLMAPLKWPMALLTLAFALAVVAILWTSSRGGGDVMLIPCIIGFLATLSAHSLIANFQQIPRRVAETDSLWTRIRIRFYRSIFWLLGLIFISTTLTFLSLVWRLLGIWINEY